MPICARSTRRTTISGSAVGVLFEKRTSLLPRMKLSKSNAALRARALMNLLIGGNPN